MPAYLKKLYIQSKGFTTFSLHERGFTLIELLVVISIIAILSVIGITLFTNVQKGARDSRRISDINAVANALEANYDAIKGTYPNPNNTAFFASGAVPGDPLDPTFTQPVYSCGLANSGDGWQKRCWYCKSNNLSANPKTTPTYCAAPDWAVQDNNWGTGPSTWWVCANLEKAPGFYCKRSSQ